jgi:hypothetical protein
VRLTEQTIYLAGMAPAFLAGLVWGEWERRTSEVPADRDALLVPAIIGVGVAVFWQMILGVLVFIGLGLGARAIVGRLIVWLAQPREPGCPAHPHVDRPIVRPEWADCCTPDCWTRIPQRDLRQLPP